MNAFSYCMSTKIIFGNYIVEDVGFHLKNAGFTNILFIYGTNSLKASGNYDIIIKSLQNNGISFVEYGGITPNPDIHFVYDCLDIFRKRHFETILAVGGGSTIDVAKSVAVSCFLESDKDPLLFSKKKLRPQEALPVIAVPTIVGSGSECSDSCVISDYKNNFKAGFNSDLIRPKMAILDPALTYSVSKKQTTAGVLDTMMHSLERYFEPTNYELVDAWALELVRDTLVNGRIVLNDLKNEKARSTLMLNSSFSHNGILGLAKIQSFSVHPLEHALSALYPNITHGLGVGLVFLGWASFMRLKIEKKLARMARIVFENNIQDDKESSIMCLDAWRQMLSDLGAPTSLKELGILDSDIDILADIVTAGGTRVVGPTGLTINRDDVVAIYRLIAK